MRHLNNLTLSFLLGSAQQADATFKDSLRPRSGADLFQARLNLKRADEQTNEQNKNGSSLCCRCCCCRRRVTITPRANAQ